ncbi:MAG: winged helix DNA-binding domain-containing protein, partial [Actinobacteria bacterium]|nr:winged helix DNA-binding domain-containing protein [Actinomycetota bacterium]
MQNSPPGSALVALHARVSNMSQARMDGAIEGERSLLQSWCMRGAPFFFPTVDAAVFTTGVLPGDEAAQRRFIRGVEGALDELVMSLGEAVELIEAEVRDVLSGRQLAIKELGVELGERIAPKLAPARRKVWQRESPPPLSKRVVHFCLRILALKQIICFASRTDNKAPFVLVDEWLGEPLPIVDRDFARAELTRRYLRCYGPSTLRDFASWVGIAPAQAKPWWRLVEEQLREVNFGGNEVWILADDLVALRSPPAPIGLRLLAPHDPFTQLRDRETLVPNRRLHPKIWKLNGAPGT